MRNKHWHFRSRAQKKPGPKKWESFKKRWQLKPEDAQKREYQTQVLGGSYTSVVMGGGSLEKDKENKEESERKWQVQKSTALQNPRPERVVRKEKPTQVRSL